ncbi:MAG: hypothetical protein KAG96_03025 [Ichthyobacteriaceae bacterium]|nr:hypothetical protein [Ichthyobacteriaceae bacterium]
MKDVRIYVDFDELIEEDLVILSSTDIKHDSKGKKITLKEGLKVKVYSDDLCGCNMNDNLIADGVVELNTGDWERTAKWYCRINKDGIYNESQKRKK